MSRGGPIGRLSAELSGRRGVERETTKRQAKEVRTLKNQELTKLIGRRLKQALGDGEAGGLPPSIQDSLDGLRRAEMTWGASSPPVAVNLCIGPDGAHPAAPPERDGSIDRSRDVGTER